MGHIKLARRFASAFIGSILALQSVVAQTPPPGVAAEARLVPPASGKIRVAFLVSPNANMIDLAGPWEVFQDVRIPGRGSGGDDFAFELFTVAETRDPIAVTGGMRVVPRYDFADAPQPQVIVVPSQSGRFLAAPESFEIQSDGACAAMLEAGATPGSGDPDRYLVRGGRIYIFATEACRDGFAAKAH